MRPLLRQNWARFSKTLACVVGLLVWLNLPQCGKNREATQHQALLEGLPEDLVDLLVAGDDSTLAEYGREAGYRTLSTYCSELGRRFIESTKKQLRSEQSLLIDYMRRIADVLKSEYHYEYNSIDIGYLESLSPDDLRAVITLREECKSAATNPNSNTIENLEKQFELLKISEKYRDRTTTAMCYWNIWNLYEAIGNEAERVKYLRAACAVYREIGAHVMTCQALGILGGVYERAGEVDSMIICYEEAKAIADRSRLPTQAPRILEFYATYYARRGRLSLAHELYNEAMEICREYKGGCIETRYIVDAMMFHADLGCWDIVKRLIERARVIARDCGNVSVPYFEIEYLRVDMTEARMQLALRKVDEANAIFQKTFEAIEALRLPYSYRSENVRLLFYWAEGLLERGLVDNALVVINTAFDRDGEELPRRWSAQFPLLLAKTNFRRGNMQATEWALQQFEHFAHDQEESMRKEWIDRDALLGKIRLRTGGPQAAVPYLECGLERMREWTENMEPSVQSYLWIGECEELRQLLHDLTVHDPTLGYGAELLWRDFYRLLGRRTRGARPDASKHALDSWARTETGESLFENLRSRAVAAANRIEQLAAVHSAYVIRDGEIWRWTVSQNGIRRETLDGSTDQIRRLAAETWKEMSMGHSHPNAMPPASLVKNLRTLARLLLPPEVAEGGGTPSPSTFFVTTDGFLGRMPFETFDVGNDDEYTPLLLFRDVAYARYADTLIADVHAGPGVILVNTELSQALKNRYPFQQQLKEAMAEGEAVAALDPSARFLTGESATKSELQSVWRDASFIYIAAHTLSDPEVPYLVLIPLATSGAASIPDAAYLDVTDIRAADFAGSPVVVLSGCSSGVPYVGARSVGPSLGDAFLDAGAAAVVQTFWDVRDDEAKELMIRYVQTWRDPGASRIHALCDARRSMLRGPDGIRHPFNWASYSIKTGKF